MAERNGCAALHLDLCWWYGVCASQSCYLPLTIAPSALEVSKHPENIQSKFVVLVLRKRTPRPTAVLKMFEYVNIFVIDRAEYALRIRGKPLEAEFQTVLETTKQADDFAKRQGMLGAALVMTDIGEGLRGTPVVMKPSALAKDDNDDWEITIKRIINEGLSIKKIFRAQEKAGTLPPISLLARCLRLD
jgi:hypothetical protein